MCVCLNLNGYVQVRATVWVCCLELMIMVCVYGACVRMVHGVGVAGLEDNRADEARGRQHPLRYPPLKHNLGSHRSLQPDGQQKRVWAADLSNACA